MSATRTRCRSCNALNGAELFCRSCDAYLLYDDASDAWVDTGAEAGIAAAAAPPGVTRCPRPGCGTDNPPGAVFCATCDGFLPWEPVLRTAHPDRVEGGSAPRGAADRAPNADHEPDPGDERVPAPKAVLPGPPTPIGGPIERAPLDRVGGSAWQVCGRDGCDGVTPPDRWFCSRCGEPLRPTPAAQTIAGRTPAVVRADSWWQRLRRRWTAPVASPMAPAVPAAEPVASPASPAGDRPLADADRSKGALAVAEALSPAIKVRPVPPGPLDTVRAGLGKGRPGRIGAGFVAKLALGLVAIVGLLAIVERVREPLARRLSYEMAVRGLRPYQIYDPLVPSNAAGSTIAPGRSGRYASDGLATTYWADNPADPRHVAYRDPWIDFDFREFGLVPRVPGASAGDTPVTVDQIGIAIGIQNGDFPFRANPRPKRIEIVYGLGCVTRRAAGRSDYLPRPGDRVAPRSSDCRVEVVDLADKPGFQRFRIPRMKTIHVTVYVTEVHRDVTSATSPVRAPAGWVAVTDITFFERLSFERFDERHRQTRSAKPSSS